MQGHLRAFLHRKIHAGNDAMGSVSPSLRYCTAIVSMILVTFGCATADLIEAPRRSTSLEEVLADERKDGECFKFVIQIPEADDTQRPIWQETITDHLQRCGGEITLHYLRTLIREPTVPANDEARAALKRFLVDFATRHNLSFTEIGQDDIWILERGAGAEFIDFVALLDVQPSPLEMPINRRTTVPAFELNIELDRIYGRGVEDNKSAIAAVLTVFHAMNSLPESATKRIRLIIPTSAKTDLSSIRTWKASHRTGPALFLLNSHFPATPKVFGAEDLILRLPREVNNLISPSPWRLETLGGGNSATSTPSEALMILKFRGNNAATFEAELQNLSEIGERQLKRFPQGLSLDIRALEEGYRAWIMIRSQSGNFADSIVNPNPLLFLGTLASDLELVGDHGSAALEVLNAISTSTPWASLSPVMLRLTPDEALLRIRNAREPSISRARVEKEASQLLKHVQDKFWNLTHWERAPIFEEGYEVSANTPALKHAHNIFARHFPGSDLSGGIDRDGVFARTLPGAIGFGPLLPNAERTSASYAEFLPRQVVDRWAKMLFELVVELSADDAQLSE